MRVATKVDGDVTTLSITLEGDEASALGIDAFKMIDRAETLLRGLYMLRTGHTAAPSSGPVDLEALEGVIGHAEQLTNWAKGIQDAAIRGHVRFGGTYGQLAIALDVVRSTAQSRRDALTGSLSSGYESWARFGGPAIGGRRIIDMTPDERRAAGQATQDKE